MPGRPCRGAASSECRQHSAAVGAGTAQSAAAESRFLPQRCACCRHGPRHPCARISHRRVSTAQIQKLLAGYINRDLAPADLRQATDSIAKLYHRSGWLARVLVPRQRVENGVLLIQVIEGRLGKIVFSNDTNVKALHVSPQRIVDRVQARLTPGASLSQDDLTRGVLLAGDLPGVSVAADETSGND